MAESEGINCMELNKSHRAREPPGRAAVLNNGGFFVQKNPSLRWEITSNQQ